MAHHRSVTHQTTKYVYGVTKTNGSVIDSNDLLGQTQYPITHAGDGTLGDPGTASKYTVTRKYNALGDAITMTDRNGNTHAYAFDALGRPTSDSVTTLGSGVDGNTRRYDTSCDTGGATVRKAAYPLQNERRSDMETEWRELSAREKAIIEKLLSEPFPGRDELLEQVKTARVRAYEAEGSLDVRTSQSCPRAPVLHRVPVAGIMNHPETPVEVLLHVLEGRLVEFEIVIFSRLPNYPIVPEDLTVSVAEGAAGDANGAEKKDVAS